MEPLHSILKQLRFLPARAASRVMHLYWRMSRGLTLGVRGLVIDGQGHIFLVKHTYINGWHLPGGLDSRHCDHAAAALTAGGRQVKERHSAHKTSWLQGAQPDVRAPEHALHGLPGSTADQLRQRHT